MEKWRERIAAAVAETAEPGAKPNYKRISVEAGLGATFVRDLLDRRTEPRVEHLRKLAEYLGLSMEYLFAEESNSMEIGPRLQLLREKLCPGEGIPYWVTTLREPSITANDWIALENGYRRPSDAEILAIIRRTDATSDWILYNIPGALSFDLAETLGIRKKGAA